MKNALFRRLLTAVLALTLLTGLVGVTQAASYTPTAQVQTVSTYAATPLANLDASGNPVDPRSSEPTFTPTWAQKLAEFLQDVWAKLLSILGFFNV
ncbi:MAG: hypothetical protein LBN05_05205 [Oscillospiraceae bacterium]|jgi:peptidoglycan/LPS O-acetylase OafA/YrhL|nr:hypothetical protein [Oscillospiraceae bacterium]